MQQTVRVYCCHSISIQRPIAYFFEQRFKEVSNMIGEFKAWGIIYSESVKENIK